MRRMLVTLTLMLTVSLAVPAAASALTPLWWDDGFGTGVSGQAIYEDMMIHPEAVRGPDGRTYVVYQGPGLDPYIMALNTDGTWDGPVRVGINALADTSRGFDDTHGAPSLYIDPGGYLHVFFGAHLSRLQHARSSVPLDIRAWESGRPVPPHVVTYPQPALGTDGTLKLCYRLDTAWNGFARGSWMQATMSADGSHFTTATAIVAGDDLRSWYAHTAIGASGRMHTALVPVGRRDPVDQNDRKGIYYLYADADGIWRDVRGRPAASPASTKGVTFSDLTTGACTVYPANGQQQNQVTVAEDASGKPGILFVSGSGYGPGSHRWVFARWNGSAWATSTIAETDHLFDSSTLDFTPTGIDAFLTIGGSSGYARSASSLEDRGGDIARYHSDDDGATWSREETIAVADRARGRSFNDPQIIVGQTGDPRLVFGEWNNDGIVFVHRVFLWGSGGFKQREFFPTVLRLSGADRYETAAAVSKSSFPNGAVTAFVVSGAKYADALAAVPLAYASSAPVLLTNQAYLSSATRKELARLRCTKVVIVGSAASVSSHAAAGIHSAGSVNSVRRIGGADRYDVAANIAKELRAKYGNPRGAFIVSGEKWPDALAAAPVAAQLRFPVLLTRRTYVPWSTRVSLQNLADGATVLVAGGEASVASSAEKTVGASVRIGGADRYEVADGLARLAIEGTGTLAPSSEWRRFSVVSGATFGDALSAGVLVARERGAMLLTPGGHLWPSTRSLVDERARHVLGVTIVGGTSRVSGAVANDLATVLAAHQFE